MTLIDNVITWSLILTF